MFGDAKSKYLYAFDAAVNALICAGGDRSIASNFYQLADRRNGPGFHLSEGMWTNAHMHHGMGTPVEEGARRFYEDVLVKYHSKSLQIARAA